MSLQLITTSDGSHSLLNSELNETYHSVHGALRESIHVFIKHGLEFFAGQNSLVTIHIFEVGFGTGLNALLTLEYALKQGCQIHYTSVEAFPIDHTTARSLNYPDALSMTDAREYFERLHAAPWDVEAVIAPGFTLLKKKTSLQEITLMPEYDVIYFDAFAPSKQPEMWELSVLEKVRNAIKPGGVFVTYCAKGQLKRDLKTLGLVVETLPGPPGKKEMVRGVLQS